MIFSSPYHTPPHSLTPINQELGQSKYLMAAFVFGVTSLTYFAFPFELYFAIVVKVVAVTAKIMASRGITVCQRPCPVVMPAALACWRCDGVDVPSVPWRGHVPVSLVWQYFSGLGAAEALASWRAGGRGVTVCRRPCYVTVTTTLTCWQCGGVGMPGVPWCCRVSVSLAWHHAGGQDMVVTLACWRAGSQSITAYQPATLSYCCSNSLGISALWR